MHTEKLKAELVEAGVEELASYWRTNVKAKDTWTRARTMIHMRIWEGVAVETLVECARRYALELDEPPTKYAEAAYRFYSHDWQAYADPSWREPPKAAQAPTDPGLLASPRAAIAEPIADPDEWLKSRGATSFRELVQRRRGAE